MSFRNMRWAIVAFVLWAAPARAEAVPEPQIRAGALSLEEVVANVETNFPLLKAAERDRAIAAADALTAEGGFDPALRARATTIPYGGYKNDRFDVSIEQPTALWGTRFFGGWRYGQGTFAPYDGKYETADYGEGRVGAQIPIWRDGPIDRRRAAIQKAELARSIADLSVAEQRLVIVRSASVRYWDWVAASRRVAIARDLLAMATTRDAQLAARVDRGDLPAYERAENLRVLHQREAQVAAAERGLENAAIELSLYVRTDNVRAPNLPPLGTANASEADALSQRPEAKRLAALIEQARVELTLAEIQKKPGIDLLTIGSKDFGPGPAKITPTELEVTVLLDIPILNRVQEGRRQAAEAQIAKYTDQQRFAKDRIVADVRDAISAITRAHDRASAVHREIDAARGLVDSERTRFEQGDSTLLMVNLREQAYAEAELREVDAIADHHRGAAMLRAAMGRR